MEMTLSENIRAFRKQRSLTQEQLAEVLGVTPGAVYKWEAKLSVPELPVIIKLADFFDTSVDVLLGYQIRNNSLDALVERLSTYIRNSDPAALSALEKLPASFTEACKTARDSDFIKAHIPAEILSIYCTD